MTTWGMKNGKEREFSLKESWEKEKKVLQNWFGCVREARIQTKSSNYWNAETYRNKRKGKIRSHVCDGNVLHKILRGVSKTMPIAVPVSLPTNFAAFFQKAKVAEMGRHSHSTNTLKVPPLKPKRAHKHFIIESQQHATIYTRKISLNSTPFRTHRSLFPLMSAPSRY